MSRNIARGVRSLGVLLALVLAFQVIQPQRASAAAAILLNPNSGPPGTTVQVSGSGFTPGETVTITFAGFGTVQTTTAGPSGQIFTTFNVPVVANGPHTVTATGSTSHLSATATFTVTSASTHFSLQKSVAVNGSAYGTNVFATPGDNLTYLIQYTNTGGTTASNTTISDALQPGQQLISFSPGCGASTSGGVTTVTCPVGSVTPSPAAGSSGSITIVTQVAPAFVGTIPNTAYISATGIGAQPSNTTHVTVNGPGGPGATALTKRVSVNGSGYVTSANAHPGDTMSYDITFTNNTGATLSNVVIADVIQPGQTLLSYPGTSASCTSYNAATGELDCPVGNVGPGSTIHVFIGVQVNNTNAVIHNQASASWSGNTIYSNTTTVSVFGVGPPPPVNPGTGQFQLCGLVTAFSYSSITINGVTISIVPGAVFSGTVLTGQNVCIVFTFNGYGQATAVAVTSNLAGVNIVCGIFTPTAVFTSLTIGGYVMPVASGWSYSPYLTSGGYYCFLINSAGQIYSVLSNIPTSASLSATHSGSFRTSRALGF